MKLKPSRLYTHFGYIILVSCGVSGRSLCSSWGIKFRSFSMCVGKLTMPIELPSGDPTDAPSTKPTGQ